MATVEKAPTKRHARPHPFAWMKRLTNLKSSSSDSSTNVNTSKRNNIPLTTKSRKTNLTKNNPYPASGKTNKQEQKSTSENGHLSFSTPPSVRSVSYSSDKFPRVSQDGHRVPKPSNNSTAPTLATNPDTLNSETTHSRGGISNTASGGMSSDADGVGGSTFSSPSPSVRSLTTTLTTIQSIAPGPGSNTVSSSSHPGNAHQTSHNNQTQPSHFTHQFPSSSPPASALPAHLQTPHAGGGHPATYTTATANNILTDNASILTLASSSKRRRRNSIDTNASVRALAPSSVWGGSRESLPLSVLSANIGDSTSTPTANGPPPATAPAGMRPDQRVSVYSSSGVAPALPSERNSFYAGKAGNTGDGGSVRSGLLGHGRNDSVSGSIGGAGSPLASPRDVTLPGRISRRSSGWGDVSEEDSLADKEEYYKGKDEKGKGF